MVFGGIQENKMKEIKREPAFECLQNTMSMYNHEMLFILQIKILK